MRFLPLVLLLVAVSMGAQELAPDAKTMLNQMSGVELLFRRPDPKLATLIFKAVGTGELKGRKLIRYSIRVSGQLKESRYILMTWDIGTRAPVVAVRDVKIDDQGFIQCGDKATDCLGAEPGSQIVVGLSGMIGQPRRFILTGADKMPLAMGEVVPFPARGTDRNCSIEAVLLAPNGAFVLILGHGFEANEPVKFVSSSYDESVGSPHTADAAGAVVSAVLPFVKGHDEGKTAISLTGTKCSPGTAFNWGAYREEMMEQQSAK